MNKVLGMMAGAFLFGLAAGPAQAQYAGDFGAIVGTRQSEGEATLAARGYQPGPGGTWWNPREQRCARMAVVSGRIGAMRIEPVMVCRHEDRAANVPVAPPLHAGEVPRDYDMVCSSSPGDLGGYVWDVDRDRYAHTGRVDLTPGELTRTVMLQVSGARAKVLLPARMGRGGWTWLDSASVGYGGVRARLAGGATLSASPASGRLTIRTPKRVLYAGRCDMITAVGSRSW